VSITRSPDTTREGPGTGPGAGPGPGGPPGGLPLAGLHVRLTVGAQLLAITALGGLRVRDVLPEPGSAAAIPAWRTVRSFLDGGTPSDGTVAGSTVGWTARPAGGETAGALMP
jgi:hypothetical protein